MNKYCEAFIRYVEKLGEKARIPDFVWDEWDVENYAEPIDDQEIERLDLISVNALIALSTAMTFWQYVRLRRSGMNPAAEHLLECIACSSNQRPSFEYLMLDPDEWRGPSNGPVAVSIDALNAAIFADDELYVIPENTFMVLQITRRAVAQRGAFEAWYLQARERLIERHPSGVRDILKDTPRIGVPVALSEMMFDGVEEFSFEEQREALSPDNPFRIS